MDIGKHGEGRRPDPETPRGSKSDMLQAGANLPRLETENGYYKIF